MEKHSLRLGLRFCLPGTILVLISSASGQPFVSPIDGTPYGDWTIVNYVDLDASGGVLDFRNGNYTYDGHNGIDFTLANFAKMDAGVPVYAAAAGTVIYMHDGEFDRCSRVNPCGNFPNYVGIEHAGGVVSEYLHLKKDSISVNVGQSVAAGQQIGEVGSSGLSSDAHLHFAVYENTVATETYLDPDRWWSDPVPYADDVFGSLDHGIVDHFPSTAEFVDRPVDTDVFELVAGFSQRAVFWAHLHGIDAGDDLDYYFFRPNGVEFAHFHFSATQIRYGWSNAGVNLPSQPDLGTWTAELRLNGATLIADSFVVVGVLGDYSRNGVVDAADYVTWRESQGQLVAPYMGADGDGDGMITAADLDVWHQNFGRSAPEAAASGATVPEPANLFLTTMLVFVGLDARFARRRHLPLAAR